MTAALAADVRIACADADPDLFFRPATVNSRTNLALAVEVARTYCAGCPALTECRDRGDATASTGIWGGVHRHHDGSLLLHTTDLLTDGTPVTHTRKVTRP